MDSKDINEHLKIARALAEEAGPISLEYFRQPHDVENKLEGGYFDPVTAADKRIEEKLREGLLREFPGYAIMGEEFGSEGDSDFKWVIDPIDGTRAFISGVPAWGVLLGLMEGDECLGGLMHQPFLGETYLGDADGAWLYNKEGRTKLQSRQDATLSDSILYCTHPFMFDQHESRQRFVELSMRCRLQRYGGDCYSYCLLAHGCVDIVVEGLLQPYDIIPLIPIITASGGVVTNLAGEVPLSGGTVVAAANPALHAEVLTFMNEHKLTE